MKIPLFHPVSRMRKPVTATACYPCAGRGKVIAIDDRWGPLVQCVYCKGTGRETL